MTSISKTLFGTVAAGAMAVATASPAIAQDRHRDRDRGISTEDVVTGALIIGGIAAIAAIASDDDDDRYDRRYRDRRYNDRYDNRRYNNRYDNRRGNERDAVNQCIRAAERTAQRYGGGRAEVYEIRDVDRERRGFEVKGRIAVQQGYGYSRNSRRGGWDEGRFTCDYRRGQVVDIDFSGIRGLR